MSILITGGAGFIGSHLANALVTNGHAVVVVDRLAPHVHPLHAAVQVHRLDLRERSIAPLLGGVHTVVHLASSLGIKHGIDRPWDQLDNNLTSTKQVLEDCHVHDVRLIHGSSSAVYGMTDSSRPLKEEDAPVLDGLFNPSGNYALSKLIQERMVMAFTRQFGLRAQIVRFFNCIGGGQRPTLGHVLPSFIRSATSGTQLLVHNGGHQRRTFMHVSDAVEALILIIAKGENGGIYNIGGTEEVRIIDLAHMVIALTGSASRVEPIGNNAVFCDGFIEPTARVPDIGRLLDLGFHQPLSLRDAVHRAILESRIPIETVQ